jgi:hypothetical protein
MTRTPTDTTGDVLTVLARLADTVRTVRLVRGHPVREVARLTGLSASTITRVEEGEDCRLTVAVALLRYVRDSAQ